MPTPNGRTGRFVAKDEFDRLAPRYERGSRLMSLGQIVRWRKKAVAALAPHAGGDYLDVGAGTGELSKTILRVQRDARVVAVDENHAMMAAGHLDTIPGVTTQVADACATGLRASSFDGAVSGFLLRHLPEPRAFFAEMRRILRPGAGLVLLEAHLPPGRVRRALFRVYFNGFAWILGAIVTRTWKAHVGLRQSVRSFAGVEALLRVAKDGGFEVRSVERGAWTGFFLVVLRRPAAVTRS